MARNKLTEDASKIADLIYKKSAEKTNKEIAEKIGIDPSNLGRFQSNYLEMVCAYLDEIGLGVHVKNESRLVSQDEHRALVTLAKKAIEEMEQQ
ncbi:MULTISPECIES: CII family transcriptional regulator [Avibacterium]|uniref:CII family transcriptional regulator n=1 Tax=Avibacterium TaxID=292486 RepID=UPI0039FDC64A